MEFNSLQDVAGSNDVDPSMLFGNNWATRKWRMVWLNLLEGSHTHGVEAGHWAGEAIGMRYWLVKINNTWGGSWALSNKGYWYANK